MQYWEGWTLNQQKNEHTQLQFSQSYFCTAKTIILQLKIILDRLKINLITLYLYWQNTFKNPQKKENNQQIFRF